MVGVDKALQFLGSEMEKTENPPVLSFKEYLEYARQNPRRVLRNIFQLVYDMVHEYVGVGVDEYPDDPESIGFEKYDCTKIFTEGVDNPFFADRLFANRFIRQIENLTQGFQQNRMYVYDGPSGCGKSTFLNGLLHTFETYTSTKEGQTYEILWNIKSDEKLFQGDTSAPQYFTVSCPSHDYPILIIPKEHRAKFLGELFSEETLREIGVGYKKEYEWIFRGDVCTICKSIFDILLEKLGSLDKVLSMVTARPCKFNRRLGEGISIFNPGDRPLRETFNGKSVAGGFFANPRTQNDLDQVFGVNAVRYIYSHLAKTNNGIYVLMDVKGYNEDRLLELHNVISEGVHKVGDIEEHINSLFFALMNPEDKQIIEEKKMESFQGRIQYNKILYVLEPATEVDIYRTVFGDEIKKFFLPRVLENFARVMVSSRMKEECAPLKTWIPELSKYKRYCDRDGRLLRMEIYGGVIPDWLSEEDKKKFTAPVRHAIILGGESEGDKGFSGRDSVRFFNEFLSRYRGRTILINMDNVIDFFKHHIERKSRDDHIPPNFLSSLVDSYDYAILGEMKESLYFYNKERVAKDILTYLWATDYDVGTRGRCGYTGEEVEVTADFLRTMAIHLTGKTIKEGEALRFAQDIQKKYIVVRAREQAPITETDLYRDLFSAYAKNLKENVLQPFIKNPNFREAIKNLGVPEEFDTFDTRLKEHIVYMMKNLVEKFKYTEQGAKEMCLYVIDKNLYQKFS